MPLWGRLYSTFWLAFFSWVLIPRWMGTHLGLPLHVLLGLAMLVLAWTNAQRLAASPVPARLKRISKVTAGFATFQIAGGLALGIVTHAVPSLLMVSGVLRASHVVGALTILAQTSSVATAYDMWEEREFAAPLPPSASQGD